MSAVELLRDWGLSVETDTRTDLTFQAPLHTNRMSRPDNMSCPGQPILSECIRAGQEAWQRLSSGQTRQDWLLVGKACQLLRIEAMRAAHTNRPEGRRTRQDTARDIAGVVFRTISPSKEREVARELNRLVRAAEAGEAGA